MMMYLALMLLFFTLGVYYLIIGAPSIMAVHFLLISLYFYLVYFELKGRPFSPKMYIVLIVLLITEGATNLIFNGMSIISSVISLCFAYSTWRSYKRLVE